MKRTAKIMAVLGLLVLCGSALAVAGNEPIAHWKFDEGSETKAYDSAGTNNGTVYGAVWTTGQIDGALSFDGLDDYVGVGDPVDGSLDFGTGNFSISLWFKTTDSTGELVDKSGGGAGRNLGYCLFIGNVEVGAGGYTADPGALCIRARDGSNQDQIQTTNTYDDGNWHHVVAIRAGSGAANLYIYVDGVAVNTSIIRNTGAGNISNSYGLSIGAKYDAGDSNRWEDFLNGSIDDVRIYDRALSDAEIREIYLDTFSSYERAIIQIEDAVAQKEEMLEVIDEALDKEVDAYNALEELLESKDYGDLKKGDIVTAKQKIYSAIQHEEQSMNTLAKSIEKLEDSLGVLGCEVEPNGSNN